MSTQDWIALAILAINVLHNAVKSKQTRTLLISALSQHRQFIAKTLVDIFASVEVHEKSAQTPPAARQSIQEEKVS